jgi:hypothetical protein
MGQVEKTSVGSICLSYRLQSGDMSVVLLYHVLVIPSLRKSLYSWTSVKSIGKFAIINHPISQVVPKLDSSAVSNPFQSKNNFVLDLVPSKSASLANDTNYDFWHTFLIHLFNANVNRKTLQRFILNSRLSIHLYL